jgi:uncharacterized membrane protein YphA (DoxX/SURF4 family)
MNAQPAQAPEFRESAQVVKIVARVALGSVWLYQGVLPKLVLTVPLELDIVERIGLYVVSARWTLGAVGIVEALLGIWILSGFHERLSCVLATLMMLVLEVLVVIEEPSLLIGPFGGLTKNLCLVACAWIVWYLSPLTKR